MDITDLEPRRVLFNQDYTFYHWGGCKDPTGILEPNKEYLAKKIEVHSWHTRVWIDGIDGYFSSTAFSEKEPTRT